MEEIKKSGAGHSDALDHVSGQAAGADDSGGKKKKEKKKTVGQEILSLLCYLGIVLILTFLIVNFVGVRTEVLGTSMQPTLMNRDQLIVEKVSYYFNDPQRYDIIVFPYPEEPSKHYIKRIIGLPGETVQIIDGYVYINGELLDEHYGNAVMNYAGVAEEPIVLGDDEYFVLGDNRNNSEDSRYANIGNVKEDYIIGRAWYRITSFGDMGRIK